MGDERWAVGGGDGMGSCLLNRVWTEGGGVVMRPTRQGGVYLI